MVAELGMSAAVFEKEAEAGGQLLRIFNPVTNYIGINAAGGRELRDIFVGTYSAKGPQPEFSAEISEIDTEACSVTAGNGRQMSARASVIATGVRRRRLSVPGEALLTGKGVFVSGSRDRESARGKTVVIVGGGDAALENALILAEFAKKVYVVHRRAEITARAEFADPRGVKIRSSCGRKRRSMPFWADRGSKAFALPIFVQARQKNSLPI